MSMALVIGIALLMEAPANVAAMGYNMNGVLSIDAERYAANAFAMGEVIGFDIVCTFSAQGNVVQFLVMDAEDSEMFKIHAPFTRYPF